MSTIKLVISDLHLADGSPILDCFGARQQSAFADFLHAASSDGKPLGRADTVELIVNGDCFDFLVTTPYASECMTDEATALLKIDKIIAAHAPFFATLRAFLAVPGRSLTFLIGNHDLELCFTKVCERICQALVGKENDPKIYFCPNRFYRPLPDVYIEHGNHFDLWNREPEGIWNEQGQPLLVDPSSIPLAVGTWYYQYVTYLISLRYPFIDHFEPSISHLRQIGLICLFDPALLLEMARLSMQMVSETQPPLSTLAPGDERDPVKLFDAAIPDFVQFRQKMVARQIGTRGTDDEQSSGQISPEDIMEYSLVRSALALPRMEAVAAICTPSASVGEPISRGIYAVLENDAKLRYALAGHTHMVRADPVKGGQQVYLNTGSWVERYAQPAPGEVTPELVAWLQSPDWHNIPLRDVTQLPFALITADDGPASASLCVWDTRSPDHYHVLA